MRELPGVPDDVPTASGAETGADEPVRGRDPTDGEVSEDRSGIESDGWEGEANVTTAGEHDRRGPDTGVGDLTDTVGDSDSVGEDSGTVDTDDTDASAGACGFEVAGDPEPGLPSDAVVESLLADASGTHDGDTDLVSITLSPNATDDDVSGVRSGIAQSLGVVADAKSVDADRRRLDLLVSSGHDPTVLADALSAVDQVDGVIVADVGTLYETVLDGVGPAGDDEHEPAGDDVTADGSGSTDEQPGIDAGSIFDGLRETHEQVAYEELLDELETVEFGFEPIDGQTPGDVDPDGDSDITDVDAFLENIFEAGLEEDVEAALEVGDAGDADESGESESDGAVATATGGGFDGDLELENPDPSSTDEAGSSNGDVTSGNDGSTPPDADEAPSLGDLESDGAFDLGETPTDPAEGVEHEPEDGHEQPPDSDVGVTPAADEIDTETVIRALERTFTDDAVPERTRQAIREALDLEASRSLDVRMQYLQRRVDTLAAYTASWEAFIEENGSGTDFVESVQAEIDALAGTVEAEGERIDSLADRMDDFDDRLGGSHDRLEAYGDRFEEYDERFERFEDRFEGYDERFERFEDRFGTVEERFARMADRFEVIEDSFDDVEDRLDAVDDRLDGVTERVDALETTIAELERIEGTVDELETVMAEVEDAMADLSAWRTKVTAALRGDGAAGRTAE